MSRTYRESIDSLARLCGSLMKAIAGPVSEVFRKYIFLQEQWKNKPHACDCRITNQQILPPELWMEVMQNLSYCGDISDVVRLSRTCRELYVVARAAIQVMDFSDNVMVVARCGEYALQINNQTLFDNTVASGIQERLSIYRVQHFIVLDIFCESAFKIYVCSECWRPSASHFECLSCRDYWMPNKLNNCRLRPLIEEYLNLHRAR